MPITHERHVRREIDVPLSVRVNCAVSRGTRAELESIRQAVAVALTRAQGDTNRQKFIPGLQRYRDALELVLSIEAPPPAAKS